MPGAKHSHSSKDSGELLDNIYREFLLSFVGLCSVLRKFGSSKSLYLEQALDQLHACIEAIPLPQYDGLDRKQKRLLIQDEDYQQLEETCVDLVEFVAPFVFEIQETFGRVEEEDLQSRKV